MSEREWKPGDVAVVNGRVCVRKGNTWEHGDERAFPYHDHQALDIRPLVVIDAEDREQVERLWVLLRDGLGLRSRDNLNDVLHALANPTPARLDEPLGLGAVVEDAEGVRWTLTMRPPAADELKASPWCRDHIPATGVAFAEWDDILAAKVLNEGWSE